MPLTHITVLSLSIGAVYRDQPVSLCVSVSVSLSVYRHISGTDGLIITKFVVHIPCGRGSVLLCRRCATLCTSGFIDDVTHGRNGRDADMWRLQCAATAMSAVAISGRSLMSMNAYCILWKVCQLRSQTTMVSFSHQSIKSLDCLQRDRHTEVLT